MSLTLALRSALTGISVSQVALNVASSNITNANTPGYTRKVADLTTQVLGAENGLGGGVSVASISRQVNQSLQLEMRSQTSVLAGDNVRMDFVQRTEQIFGNVNDNSSLTNTITDLTNSFANLALQPADPIRQTELVNIARDLASQIGSASGTIQGLRKDVDQEIAVSVEEVNTALDAIVQLNEKITRNTITGAPTGDLEDQRDQAIAVVASQLDVRLFSRNNNEVVLYTSNGYKLVDSDAQHLEYKPVASIDPTVTYIDGGFNAITFENSSLNTDLTNSFRAGRIKGLVDLRDNILPSMGEQLENISHTLHDLVNSVHNQGTSYPPPSILTGTRGINATDPFYAEGNIRVAVLDTSGNYEDYVDIDLNALTQPGPTTINDLITGLNSQTTAIGGVQLDTLVEFSISSDGKLKVAAINTNDRFAIGNAPSPAAASVERVSGQDQGFSEYFGLNDFFTSNVRETNPERLIGRTTVSSSTAFTGTGTVRFGVTNANGTVLNSYDLNLTTFAGTTVGDVVNAINAAPGLSMTASIGSDGRLRLVADNSDESVELTLLNPAANETSTGKNFVKFFDFQDPRYTATSLRVRENLVANPQEVASGKLNNQTITLPITTPITGVAPGDASIAQSLVDVFNKAVEFPKVGDISGIRSSLTSYASLFLSSNARTNARFEDAFRSQQSLFDELSLRNSSVSGVDIESEMASLTLIESAYNASSQVIRVTNQMFDQLERLLG